MKAQRQQSVVFIYPTVEWDQQFSFQIIFIKILGNIYKTDHEILL